MTLKVLIVEDNPDDSELLIRRLRRLPDHTFEFTVAPSGQDGLHALTLNTPELIFLDFNLTDMNALTFLERLSQLPLKTVVITLTGNGDEKSAVSALKAGALDYLSKNNLDSETLKRTIDSALERHRLNEQLVSTQLQISRMIQETPVGMCLLDSDLNFLNVNEKFAQFAHFPLDDMAGTSYSSIPSPLLQQLEWMCKRVLLSGRSFRDVEVSTGQGMHAEFYLVNIYPISNQPGVILWIGITVTDITRSKQDALLLQESQNQLNLTLEATKVGTWKWNPSTGEIDWLGQTAHMFGFDHFPMRPSLQDLLSGIHPEDQSSFEEHLQSSLSNHQDFALEIRIPRLDGSNRWVMARGRADLSGPTPQVLGTLVDITDLKEAELALREISQAQQRFVNDAAHELRAPLTAIQGNLDLIHRYSNMADEDKEEALADVAREATRLSRLVQDMLALAKGDAGTELRMEEFDLSSVLEDALKSTSMLTREHQLQVSDLPEVDILGDYDRLKQVLVILLDNASKYTPAGGEIRVNMESTGRHALIHVSDTGMGIAEEDQPRIFERFYRGQLSREKDPGGTGLGLPIAKWIVEKHGGKITLQSTLGVGTTLTLHLPVLKEVASH
ncbi:hybrid sensor histidine kinase/response regulator [Deinococcus misasensis]|uniref:hybrid sensor histidine kinase/response regulator n=1 Tax=Deinococcus misasensis TaxID=392413 RepID=UPI00068D4CEA|nr:hybrid sensor histidine kinase/response regulator [Deinococcus misasensis]